MEEFFPQNENLKTVLCQPSVEKSQNCEIFFWGYDGRTITRADFTGMTGSVDGAVDGGDQILTPSFHDVVWSGAGNGYL